MTTEWWLCPNEPRCPHPAVVHDVYDYDDQTPACCVDGCHCGVRLPEVRYAICATCGYEKVKEEPCGLPCV